MRINNINSKLNFKGPLDGVFTTAMRTCDMNEMVNAVGLDVGAMVIPRAWYDTTHRNPDAGFETFFREISGTFINCLSAGIFAQLIAKFANKHYMKDVNINTNSWFSKDSMETLNLAWNKTKNTKNYVANVLDNLQGIDGHKTTSFKNIDWQNIEWIDENKWNKYKWDNKAYQNFEEKLKTKEDVINSFTKIIKDENITKNDKNNALSILEARLTNALKSEREVKLKIDNKEVSSKLEFIIRDIYDMGKDILNEKVKNPEQILKKIKNINKIKAFGAISLASILGLSNQYINRKLTEKRTGKKGFVGDLDFNDKNKTDKPKDKMFLAKKILASLAMVGMVLGVMKVKNFKDFARKLEFTGPITSGNAIKTVYASVIVGRFMAADNGTELRESMTRDYLGFLNWLVFGGFFSKGIANLLDKKGEKLFNYSKEGKGIKHWLNDMTLKTHNEIASKGKEFAKKNMWKINLAQAGGIAYSAITLGILLPMMNAKITEHKNKVINNKN